MKEKSFKVYRCVGRTFQDGISFEDLLFDPGMFAANGRQVLQDEFGALGFSRTRLAADK